VYHAPLLRDAKGLNARKHVTSRIVTKEDVENVLLAIRQTYEEEEIHHHYLSYRAIVLLGRLQGRGHRQLSRDFGRAVQKCDRSRKAGARYSARTRQDTHATLLPAASVCS